MALLFLPYSCSRGRDLLGYLLGRCLADSGMSGNGFNGSIPQESIFGMDIEAQIQ